MGSPVLKFLSTIDDDENYVMRSDLKGGGMLLEINENRRQIQNIYRFSKLPSGLTKKKLCFFFRRLVLEDYLELDFERFGDQTQAMMNIFPSFDLDEISL